MRNNSLHSSGASPQVSGEKALKANIGGDDIKTKLNHLQYCTSTQFFERCIGVCIDNDKFLEVDQRLYFRSCVERAVKQCLDDDNKTASTYTTADIDHKTLIESVVRAISWKQLFMDHNHRYSGHNSISTALIEVLAATLDALLKSNYRDFGAAAIFLNWAYFRERSKDAIWSNSDKILFDFIGVNFVHNSSHSHAAQISWDGIIKICAARISAEIKSSFTLDLSKSIDDKDIILVKDESINHARCWIELLRDINEETGKLPRAISNSMIMVVSALDNVDISNLCMLDDLNHQNRKRRSVQSDDNTGPRKRQRLSRGTRSTDVLQAMHDTSLDLGDNRHQRAKRALIVRENSTNEQVSLKQILNESKAIASGQTAGEATNERSDCFQLVSDAFIRSSRISSLTVEAATLRRDLYLYLVQLDSTYIMVKEMEPRDKIESRLLCFVSDLLLRLKKNPSPSTKLYMILTLDHWRQLSLGQKGYDYLLDRLSKLIYLRDDSFGDNGAFYLDLMTEIISECDVYASPKRLIPPLSKMMEISLLPSFRLNDHRLILVAMGNVMLRRKNILSRLEGYNFNCNKYMGSFAQSWKTHEDLKAKMSLEYDDPSYWVSQCRSNDKNDELVAILQASGILGLFGNYSADFDDRYARHEPIKGVHSSNSQHSTLRAAHARLGPCPGFNNILTHPTSYHKSIVHERMIRENCSNDEQICPSQTISPFSDIDHNSVLHVIFSFLGYRSLARASQCCKKWRYASKSNQHWLRLYFRKFKSALMEEELGTLRDDSVKAQNIQSISSRGLEERIIFPSSYDGYDWFLIFKNNYISEKLVKSRSVEKSWKPRICQFVGCNMRIRNEHHMTSHWGKHLKNSQAIQRKRLKLQSLKMKSKQFSSNSITLDTKRTSKFGSDMNIVSRISLDTVESVLLRLIFPFLDFGDLIRPVCKLWNQLGGSSQLWYELYCHHFGKPCTNRLITSILANDWKSHFLSMYRARKLLRNEDSNCFGWKFRICPIVGCFDILRSSLDFELHMMKHKVKK